MKMCEQFCTEKSITNYPVTRRHIYWNWRSWDTHNAESRRNWSKCFGS